MKRICLVLDNPLRDLDGILLIASFLLEQNCEVFIVPMDVQNFDALALKPDVVLVNYVRKNNLKLLNLYKIYGIKVAVLDTEGVGRWWPKHSHLLKSQNANELVDHYYCWGKEQLQQLIASEAIQSEKIKLTGCPRYDFSKYPYRNVLPSNSFDTKFVLINTNFPVVNPRFSKNTHNEIKIWEKVGWGTRSEIKLFAVKSEKIFHSVTRIIQDLAIKLPTINFVIRPHPFESDLPYRKLETNFSNIYVKQEGTSLQWLNEAKALLHVNCFTALEAGFLGIDAISFEWINHDFVRTRSEEPYLVSKNAKSIEEVIKWLKILYTKKEKLKKTQTEKNNLKKIISNNYCELDGNSAERVANFLSDLTSKPKVKKEWMIFGFIKMNSPTHIIRLILGYKLFHLLKKLLKKNSAEYKKNTDITEINNLLSKIFNIRGQKLEFEASYSKRDDFHFPRNATFRSIRLKKIETKNINRKN